MLTKMLKFFEKGTPFTALSSPIKTLTGDGETKDRLEVTAAIQRKLLGDPTKDRDLRYEVTGAAHWKNCNNAHQAGFTIIVGTEHSLLLDLDDGAELNLDVLYVFRKTLLEGEDDYSVTEWLSKSEQGKHMVITFPKYKFTEAEAIALEVSLGSDPMRGMLCTRGLKNGIPQPRVLFQPPKPKPVK